jgi:hypothetical protein
MGCVCVQLVNSGIMILNFYASCAKDQDMDTPDEWADSLAKDIESKRQAAEARDSAVELRRNIIADQWNPLWEELMREFQAHCEAFNKRLNPERKLALHRDAQEFIIRPDALGEIVLVRHDLQAKRIEIKTPKSSISLRPEVLMTENGRLFLANS